MHASFGYFPTTTAFANQGVVIEVVHFAKFFVEFSHYQLYYLLVGSGHLQKVSSTKVQHVLEAIRDLKNTS